MYTQAERDKWETPGALYKGKSVALPVPHTDSTVTIDGFDCSWISDPQPDAGGRNYGGKTWAAKYHVDTTLATGRNGNCIGDANKLNKGKCDIRCQVGWTDCDGDPTNGCETDNSKCESCIFAKGYPDGVLVNCSSLVDQTLGFVPFDENNLPKCNGREDGDGQCIYYFCNIFDGFCDSGLGQVLTTTGCINQTTDDNYCGADWNWRDIRSNKSTVLYSDNFLPTDGSGNVDYEGGRMLDYSVFDGTGRCAKCTDLNGYMSDSAVCAYDPVVAGHTRDKVTYYKPAASGYIDNNLGYIEFDTAGNTVGDYLCQLHGALDAGDDGACDRNLCVDEDYYWANGCETAVNYPSKLLAKGNAGPQRHESNTGEFGFDYHFAYNDYVYGKDWPYNAVINGDQTSDVSRSEVRGIWCPFLQFWSLSTDNYDTGHCDVFPCPHFHKDTISTWITCVNNATADNAGKCDYICNTEGGWKDCDANPLTGCEVDIFNDGTCGSNCEQVECNAVDGLNPWYWSECMGDAEGSKCDLSICENTLCQDKDSDWTNGCETAVGYGAGKPTHNCRALLESQSELDRLHLAWVLPCNGEPGNHWAGKCEFECAPGWEDCDTDFSNGCEHDGSLCQNCTKALGYVTWFDGADFWEFWGAANSNDMFYKAVYGSYFKQNSVTLKYQFVVDPFTDTQGILHDQFEGPNVAYSKYHHAYVAAFDCTTLNTTYPGHFSASVPITCDSDATSATAGRCIYACNAANGYYDCDGDPRNGCEHNSQHQSCGLGGACRDCYFISGVDYPVDQDFDAQGINDGSQGPYQNGARGYLIDPILNRPLGDVYDERNVTYFGLVTSNTLLKVQPNALFSPLRLGCTYDQSTKTFGCNLDTCATTLLFNPCLNTNQKSSAAWKDGCEMAGGYKFEDDSTDFDCSLLGPDAGNGDMPRNTTDHTLPSFHVRQAVGTFGCDSQIVNKSGHIYDQRGAWRYILARYGRTDGTGGTVNETEGIWAFDYQGLENYFMLNEAGWDPLHNGDTISDLDPSVSDFVLYRVRGSDRIGTCYYECEYGYEDCDGDPRNGCEVLVSACRNNDANFGWDWDNQMPTNGCELALGYSKAQLQASGAGPYTYSCPQVGFTANVNRSEPIYCRGGQDGNNNNLGTCQFTCDVGYQDCDGSPLSGCEAQIGDDSCSCISCSNYLPGTFSKSTDQQSSDWIVSASTCQANQTCSLPCDPLVCADADQDWTNGCETAMLYPTPRGAAPIPSWDCSTWARFPLVAKKHHINPKKFGEIFCEGRVGASGAGTCSYQAACINVDDGAINNYQDCDNDPRNGCEDVSRWCQVGKSAATFPRGTQSDRCSSALRYFCDSGFDANNQPCESILSANDVPFDSKTSSASPPRIPTPSLLAILTTALYHTATVTRPTLLPVVTACSSARLAGPTATRTPVLLRVVLAKPMSVRMYTATTTALIALPSPVLIARSRLVASLTL